MVFVEVGAERWVPEWPRVAIVYDDERKGEVNMGNRVVVDPGCGVEGVGASSAVAQRLGLLLVCPIRGSPIVFWG